MEAHVGHIFELSQKVDYTLCENWFLVVFSVILRGDLEGFSYAKAL
jgi:hypothetical protein